MRSLSRYRSFGVQRMRFAAVLLAACALARAEKTIVSVDGWEESPLFSHAVVSNGMVYLAGYVGVDMETMVLCPDLLTLRPSSLPGQHLSVWTRSYNLMVFYVVLLLEEYQTQSSEVRGVKWEGWIIREILTGARSV